MAIKISDTSGLSESFSTEEISKPLTVTFAIAKKISGLGLTTLWALAKERRIQTVRVNRRTLITFRSLEALLIPSPAPKNARGCRGRPSKLPAKDAAA
jgi:hypothetical protein